MQIELCHNQPIGFMGLRFLAVTSVLIDQTKTVMSYFDPLGQNYLVSDQLLKFEGQMQALY